MRLIAVVLFVCFSFVQSVASAQSHFDVTIVWLEDKVCFEEGQNVQVLNFEGAYYEFDKHHFPLYKNKISYSEIS